MPSPLCLKTKHLACIAFSSGCCHLHLQTPLRLKTGLHMCQNAVCVREMKSKCNRQPVMHLDGSPPELHLLLGARISATSLRSQIDKAGRYNLRSRPFNQVAPVPAHGLHGPPRLPPPCERPFLTWCNNLAFDLAPPTPTRQAEGATVLGRRFSWCRVRILPEQGEKWGSVYFPGSSEFSNNISDILVHLLQK